MKRRDVLKAAGAGMAAMLVPQSGSAEEKPKDSALREQARKNLKLGVFTSVYASLPLVEAARRIREDGMAGVMMQYDFKDVQFNPLKPDWDVLKRINAELKKNDLEVAGTYGYFNVIDADEERRKKGEARFELLAKYWKRFEAPIISMETGSFDPQSQFADHPKNHTDEGYAAARKGFERLARLAERTGAIVAIEVYWHNLIDSIERADRLLKDVSSPSLKLTLDPANYFPNGLLGKMDSVLNEMFDRLGPHVVIAHAKDVRATPTGGQELPAAGKGELDYPLFLRRLAMLNKPMYLIIEHLEMADVPRARDFVKAQMDKI